MRRAPISLVDVAEKEWDAQLFNSRRGVAVHLGWSSYHVLRSKGSRAGYPDRTLVRDRIIFAELKREKTGPTDDQVEWLDKLAQAGGEVYLWRPSDLDEIALVLGHRWGLGHTDGGANATFLFASGKEPLHPRSLWIPGVGRADTHHNEQQQLIA